MRFLILRFLTLFCALSLSVTSFSSPDDEQSSKISKPLGNKFSKDICGQGIKPGTKDIAFLNKNILPYYISSKWLTKAPPKGWEAEKDKIIAKCHQNRYNYCDEGHRKKVEECVKRSLMMKYGMTPKEHSPIFDKKVESWEESE